jgi:hypothetical protein
MEFQLIEHHVGRPSGRVGMFRDCKNIQYMAGSVVKEDATARGLPGGCKVSSVTGTYWMEAYCQRRNVVDRVYCTHCQLYPRDHGAKTEGPLHA